MKNTANKSVDFYKNTLLLGGLLIAAILLRCEVQKPKFEAILFDNLGGYTWEITSTSEYASDFFTQGIILASGFNHAEAARSMREAIRIDSTCTMCHWGLAYVLGPNYNADMNDENTAEVAAAVARSRQYAKSATPWEALLVEANVKKYGGGEPNEEAYEQVLRKAVSEFEKLPELKVLLAESLMNQHAWDLYERKGGAPRPWTAEILSLLEAALALSPENPLANHLYIHATEASAAPDQGLASAERLSYLVPGSGHLVHMPSHTYINMGEYHKGTVANEASVRVDSAYIAECQVQGTYPQLYYPHNYHFLAACAALEGRGALAIEASFKMTQIIESSFLGKPGFETVEHYLTIPYNILVKFAQWEKILSLNDPGDAHPYRLAIWYYARGMALANVGKLTDAKDELRKLKEISMDPGIGQLWIWGINSAAQPVEIATKVLEAELAWKSSDLATAKRLLYEAVTVEDQLNYDEPPDWIFSVRHHLGDLLLKMGNPQEAQEVFEYDLKMFPNNGYALHGLLKALEQQGKKQEVQPVKAAFTKAWQYADTQLENSKVDPRERKNLTIRVGYDSPNELVYIASATCGLE